MPEDWDDIRVFLAVARSESLSGAGKLLKLDPATVGRRIARLEESLGVSLFMRSPQGYAITDAGQRLLDHATQAEQALESAGAKARGDASGLTGQIRIGAPDGCANYLLPQVCAEICAENPGLELQIVAQPRILNLSRRDADMVVAVSRPTAGRLTVQKITDYHLHLAAAESYLDREGPIRSRSDLVGRPIIGYIPDMILDRELDYLAEVGLPQPRLASNSVPVQLAWLRQGAGLAVTHDFALPFAPGVVKVLAPEIALTRAYYLVRPADDRRSPRLNRLADMLLTGLRREVARLERLSA
ncbi:MAG: LysR family transcriptional regulator [Paracoccaceae bacterium]